MQDKLMLVGAKFLMRVFSLLPINKRKIVYSSYRGSYFNDNPRAIYEQLRVLDGELVHVWLLNNKVEEYQGRQCPYHSVRAIYELATSYIWVDNCRKETWVRKRKNQKYIQTWHAGISVKKVEADAVDNLPTNYAQMAIRDSSMTDVYISPARWCSNLYRSSFWYNGEILECGYPRSDIFFNEKIHNKVIEEVKSFYAISDSRIVLYAPTFRVNCSVDVYDINYQQLINDLHKKTGENWVVLVRLHPNIKGLQNSIMYNERILDGSKYEDINKLIVSCDLFITDYSSCIFDAMELGKKIILYANDIESYDNDRGVYFSLEEMPFPLAHNNDELYAIISKLDNNNSEAIELFRSELGIIRSSNSSKIVAEYIRKIIRENDKDD